jgi:hypothetical protein
MGTRTSLSWYLLSMTRLILPDSMRLVCALVQGEQEDRGDAQSRFGGDTPVHDELLLARSVGQPAVEQGRTVLRDELPVEGTLEGGRRLDREGMALVRSQHLHVAVGPDAFHGVHDVAEAGDSAGQARQVSGLAIWLNPVKNCTSDGFVLST